MTLFERAALSEYVCFVGVRKFITFTMFTLAGFALPIQADQCGILELPYRSIRGQSYLVCS